MYRRCLFIRSCAQLRFAAGLYVYAVLGCNSQWLPPLPNNAVWTANNSCNVPSTSAIKVPADRECTADCLPGYVKTGSSSFICNEDPSEAGTFYFVSSASTLACAGEV
jgi:hypothetical protein